MLQRIRMGLNGHLLCWFGQGDCEVHGQWGQRNYSHGTTMYGCCCADRDLDDGMPWSDLRSKAKWRGVGLTNEEFKNRCSKDHPLACSHYWNVTFPRLDFMHVLDHHGVSAVFAGSVIGELCGDGRLGTSQEKRLKEINSHL